MGGYGKDGKFYNDINELTKANNLWRQREEQNKLLRDIANEQKRSTVQTGDLAGDLIEYFQ